MNEAGGPRVNHLSCRYWFILFFLASLGLTVHHNALGASTKGPDTCAACHADIFTSWKASIHAKAYEADSFQKSWKDHGQKSDCLDCHTTGHTKGSTRFEHPGVTCESCHGAMSDGHPGENKMPIPISADMCARCHKKTYQEWKISRHGTKNIRCFDCHQVHSQGLRAGGKEKLCGSCHNQRMNDFAHSTHHKEGLQCETCHMPRFGDNKNRIEGTGASGHTFQVGAEVCSRCHEEMVHSSANLPSLREKVTDVEQQMSVAGVENVFDLNEKVKNLEWQLNRLRQSVWVAAVLGLLAGLGLGWLGVYTLIRRKK